MKAVILAGGEGTRLGSLTRTTPKPMIPLGGRPLLEHQLELLKRYGFTEVLLITGYLGEVIRDHFGDGQSRGMRIEYFREETPLGTAGAVKAAGHLLKDDFLVLYGDVMLDVDLTRLVDFHFEKSGDATLVVHPNDHPQDSDLVEADAAGRITGFHPKPHDPRIYYRNLVNAALYVMSPGVLSRVEAGRPADFGKDVFPGMVDRMNLYGYLTAEYLKDVGTPERLEQVSADYASGRVSRMNRQIRRRAIFLDRDGIINAEKGYISRVEDFDLLPGVAAAIRRINASELLAIVVTNQPVVARNLCSEETVEMIHRKMETLLGREKAKLDAVYYCPHHPDAGYPGENVRYKVDCDCRKPRTGMVDRAREEFNIDLAGSFIVGDTWRDIQTGRDCGMTAYAVRSPAPYGDRNVEPDATFDSLAEAVDFIHHLYPRVIP